MLKNASMKSSLETFWHSVNILLTKPHVVNKRLWGCKTWLKLKCKPETSVWKTPSVINKSEYNITIENVEKYALELRKEAKLMLCDAEYTFSPIEIILTELYPKSLSDSQALQVIIINRENASVTFYDVSKEEGKQKLFPEFTYTLALEENEVLLNADTGL